MSLMHNSMSNNAKHSLDVLGGSVDILAQRRALEGVGVDVVEDDLLHGDGLSHALQDGTALALHFRLKKNFQQNFMN